MLFLCQFFCIFKEPFFDTKFRTKMEESKAALRDAVAAMDLEHSAAEAEKWKIWRWNLDSIFYFKTYCHSLDSLTSFAVTANCSLFYR